MLAWTGPLEPNHCIDCDLPIAQEDKQCESCRLRDWCEDHRLHEEMGA
jgi:hypothetical protein